MAYIGRPLNAGNLAVQSGTGDGSDTTPIATLDYSVGSSNSIAVYLDGVRQLAGTDFTATGTTLTFTTAPASGVGIDVYFLGLEVSIPTPADNTVSTAKLVDDAVTLAKMAPGTDGNIISYDASGNPVAIATGNDGQVLTSAGAGAPPAFEAGGKVLQVVSTSVTDRNTTTETDTSGVGGDLGLSVSITPTTSTSKFLITVSLGCVSGSSSGSTWGIILVRGTTRIGNGVDSSDRNGVFMRGTYYIHDGNHNAGSVSNTYYNTTTGTAGSAITFKANGVVQSGGTMMINKSASDSDTTNPYGSYTSSSITVMEVGA